MRRWMALAMTGGLVAACASQTPVEEQVRFHPSSPSPVDAAMVTSSGSPIGQPTPLGARAGSPHPSVSVVPATPGAGPSVIDQGRWDGLSYDQPPGIDPITFTFWGPRVYLTVKGTVKDEFGDLVTDGTISVYSTRLDPPFCLTASLLGGSYALEDVPASISLAVAINAPGYVSSRGEISFSPPRAVSDGPRAVYAFKGLKRGFSSPVPVPPEQPVPKPWPSSWPYAQSKVSSGWN